MTRLSPRLSPLASAISLSLALAACGGGDSAQQSPSPSAVISQQLGQETNAPQATGNMATDGLNWFNFRRQQIMLPGLPSNSLITTAAQRHSEYQKLNNTITHDQTPGKPGFTGATLQDRLSQASYSLIPSYVVGEVIAQTGYTDGFTAAEALITAIYHRFVIFEPMYREAGAGYATAASGYTYFTADFAASNGLGNGLGAGKFAVYPYDGQKNLPNNFFSDSEEPDPVPGKNEVGYPVSVHADIDQLISVTDFSIRQRATAALLTVQLLASQSDPRTPSSAVAIIPLDPLMAGTTYDVTFTGYICTSQSTGTCANNKLPIAKNWSFTTR